MKNDGFANAPIMSSDTQSDTNRIKYRILCTIASDTTSEKVKLEAFSDLHRTEDDIKMFSDYIEDLMNPNCNERRTVVNDEKMMDKIKEALK